MSLMSLANVKKFTDKLAICYEEIRRATGYASGSAVAGTNRNRLVNLQASIAALADTSLEQEYDFAPAAMSAPGYSNPYYSMRDFKNVISSLNSHCQARGSSVDATINNLVTYLAYYNGSGGAKFNALLHPAFTLLAADHGIIIPASATFHPGLHPSLDATTYPNGFGTRAFGGSATIGASANTTSYSAPVPVLEVTTNFADGTAPPTYSIAGTDDTGAAMTWTANLGANNPAAAISTTFGESKAADTYASVLVASSTGFVVGQLVLLSGGTPREEYATVLAIADGTHLTLEMRKAHTSGDTIAGNRSFLLTPGTASRRLVTLTGITPTYTDHTAGAIRLVGSQERFGNPAA